LTYNNDAKRLEVAAASFQPSIDFEIGPVENSATSTHNRLVLHAQGALERHQASRAAQCRTGRAVLSLAHVMGEST
jgi:hypothetical protein